MTRYKVCLLTAVTVCLLTARCGWAYVDLAPTLTRIVNESGTITVAEVVRFSSDNGAVLLKKVRDLKGTTGDDILKHQLLRKGEKAIDQAIIDWADPAGACAVRHGQGGGGLRRRRLVSDQRGGQRLVADRTYASRFAARLLWLGSRSHRGAAAHAGRQDGDHHGLAARCRPGRGELRPGS